jgi:hypothetical protein
MKRGARNEAENPEAAAEAFDRFPAQDQQEKKDIELTEQELGNVSAGGFTKSASSINLKSHGERS